VILLATSVLLGACSDSRGTPSSLEGVIVDIEARGFDNVESFELKTDDATYTIVIDPNRDYGFALNHLRQHLTTGDPVRVDLRDSAGELVALEIVDA
jgi:hypothetical protein